MMSILKRLPFICVLLSLALVFLFGIAGSGYSEDCRDNSDMVPGPDAPDPYYRAANEWTADTGGELDLYLGDSQGSCGQGTNNDDYITFSISVDQAISVATVYLTLSTWDVDYSATPIPEIDKVYINGYYVGNLTGSSDAWSINTFTVPTSYLNAPGNNEIEVEVNTLTTPEGERNWCITVDWGTISFSVSGATGVTLDGCQDTAVDTDGNGKYDRLEIDVFVTASAGGSFNLNGALYDSANHLIGWAQTTNSLTGGSDIMTLEFEGEEISCRQANGPYTLKNVTVYNTSNTSVRAFESQLCSTSPYTYTQFEACSSPYPLVISTNPVDGASGVSTGTTVSATFNMDMNASTLTTSTFTVTSASSPFAISGTVSYAVGTKTVTFTPDSALTAGTMYTATLTAGVKSSSGSPLPYAYTWSFTTDGGSGGGPGGGSGGGGSGGGSGGSWGGGGPCFCYYIPYYKDGTDSGFTFWGGVGLSNMSSTNDASVVVTIYGEDGTVLGGEAETIPAGGQKSFLAGYGQVGTEGWMLVNSDQPIFGFCFVGTLGENNYMADIPVALSKATSLVIPHVAQTEMWDTYILVCNPNSNATTANLTFVGPGGEADKPRNYSIPAMGSKKVPLAEIITEGTSSGGKVTIYATQGIAAFALYTNLKADGKVYAGINAVDPADKGELFGVNRGGVSGTVPPIFDEERRVYLPYYKDGNYSGTTFWGGVGLSNMNPIEDASVIVTIYGEDGTVLGEESETIPAGGQKSFLAGYGQVDDEGWMLVRADQPVLGLCFVGTLGDNNYMADIPVATSRATLLLIPHVAQTDMWDTYILLCNPNSNPNTVILTFVDPAGQSDTPRNYSLPAMGSKKVPLSDIIAGGTSSGGRVTIDATQGGVAAFALYTNLKFNGKAYAGINAVDPSEVGDGCACSDPVTFPTDTGRLAVTVVSAITGSALSGASVAIGGSSGTTNASGVYTFSNVSAGSDTLTTRLSGYITSTQTVSITEGGTTQITVALSPPLAADVTRIVLTWGASPSDLDSHLTGPDAPGGRFHVYYSNKTPSGAGANLDGDDVSSYGPETVTITQQRSGTYSYYVHDYSNRSVIYSNVMAQSGAQVNVYRGSGRIASYSVPPQVGTLWYVFDMDGTNGTLTWKNQMLYESSPTGTNIRAGGAELNLFRKLPKK